MIGVVRVASHGDFRPKLYMAAESACGESRRRHSPNHRAGGRRQARVIRSPQKSGKGEITGEEAAKIWGAKVTFLGGRSFQSPA